MACSPAPLRKARTWLLGLSALLLATAARADGTYPGSRQILLPTKRPEQIILATNFGLILSDDNGETWSFSCERGSSAYAGPYLLGTQGSQRLFALTAGAGLIYSDDDSCGWQAASGALSDVLPYSFAVDPASSRRVYAIGVPRQDLQNGDSLYVSNDAGVSFKGPMFTSPPRSALLNVLVAPSRPSRLFATMFSSPANHPSLLRSDDSGENWEIVADLVESLGENPFELLAIDSLDEDKLYARVLGATAETLATSVDGGRSFVQSVSIPGKLNAFLQLQSGTVLVAGTAGVDAVAYRSKDGGQTFETWPAPPHVHAFAERNGKLYVAGDSYADGYAIAVSENEGADLQPLLQFKQVNALKGCVASACAESCAYYAGIGLWPSSVCGQVPNPIDDEAKRPEPDAGAGGTGEARPASGGGEPTTAADGGSVSVDEPGEPSDFEPAGGCGACNLRHRRPAGDWGALLLVAVALLARRNARTALPD